MQSRRYRVYSSSVNQKHRRKTLHRNWALPGHLITNQDCLDASLAQVERVRCERDFRWVTITSSTISTSCRIRRNCSRQMTSTQPWRQFLASWQVELFRILRLLSLILLMLDSTQGPLSQIRKFLIR